MSTQEDALAAKVAGHLEEVKANVIIHGEKHGSVAQLYTDIGILYLASGKLDEAREYFEKSLSILTELYGETHEDTIDAHYRLGRVLELQSEGMDVRATRQHQMKTRLMREVFDDAIAKGANAKLGNALPPTAVSHEHRMNVTRENSIDSTLLYDDMGEEARLAGDYDGARKFYIKAIELRRKKYGKNSPAVASVLINYAELLRIEGKYDKAESVLKEAQQMTLKAYGNNTERSAEILNNMGILQRNKGDLDKAEILLMDALKQRRLLYGDSHELVASTLNSIAELFRERKDFIQAIFYHNSSIESYEKSVGPNHPGTINAKGNLGVTLRRQARIGLEQGEALVKGAMEYFVDKKYNEKHPWVVKFGTEQILSQAERLNEEGKYEQAAALFDNILNDKVESDMQNAMSRSISAEMMSSSQDMLLLTEGRAKSLIGRATALIKNQSLYYEADQVIASCMKAISPILPPDHPSILKVNLMRAENKLRIGDFEAANNFFVSALQSRTDIYGPDHVEVAAVMRGLGQLYAIRAQFDQSETLLLQSMELASEALKREPPTMEKSSSSYAPLYANILLNLYSLYMDKGSYASATSMLQQAIRVCSKSVDESDPIFWECLLRQGQFLSFQGDFVTATTTLTACLDLLQRQFGKAGHANIAVTFAALSSLELLKGSDLVVAKHYADSAMSIASAFFSLPNSASPSSTSSPTKSSKTSPGKSSTDSSKNDNGGMIKHPLIAEINYLLGCISSERADYEEALNLMGKSLTLRRSLFNPRHPIIASTQSGIASIQVKLGHITEAQSTLKIALDIQTSELEMLHSDKLTTEFLVAECMLSRGLLSNALSAFQKNLVDRQQMVDSVAASTKAAQNHLQTAETKLAISKILRMCGNLTEAANLLGSAGISVCRLLGENSLKIADCLFALGELCTLRGKYKDAKVLYSRSTHMRCKIWSGKVLHPLVADSLHAAADNIRIPGYFEDALDGCDKAMQIRSKIFGLTSIPTSMSLVLKAKILCDQGKPEEAQPILLQCQESLKRLMGTCETPQYLSCIVALAECYLRQEKFNDAFTVYTEAQTLCDIVYADYKESNITYLDIMSGIAIVNCMCGEPDDAMSKLQDIVKPQAEKLLGKSHPLVAVTTGRCGICRSKILLNSGEGLIEEALVFFNTYNQLSFTSDQPWIVSLVAEFKHLQSKYASTILSPSKSSSNVDEPALTTWAMPRFPGDPDFAASLPTDHSITTNTDSVSSWGAVWHRNITADDKIMTKEERKRAEEEARKEFEDNIRRQEEEEMRRLAAEKKAAEEAIALQEKLLKEAEEKARRAAEEEEEKRLLAIEEEKRRIIKEGEEKKEEEARILREAEEKKRQEEEERAREEAERKAREEAEEKALREAEEKERLEAERIKQEEEARARGEVEQTENVDGGQTDDSAQSNAPSSLPTSAVTSSIILPSSFAGMDVSNLTPAEIKKFKALDAATFLFDRAVTLYQEGGIRHWKAQPLFDEALSVRNVYFTNEDEREPVVQVLLASASNLKMMCKYKEAMAMFKEAYQIRVSLVGDMCVPAAEVRVLIAQNLVAQGQFRAAGDEFNAASEVIAKVLDPTHPTIGMVMLDLAVNYVRLNKFAEAKATADRGFAILNKAYGTKRVEFADGYFTRSLVLRAMGKAVEAKPLLEQAIIMRRRFLGDNHCDIAAGLLLMGLCLYDMGKYEEASSRFNQCYDMLMQLLENPEDVRCLEVARWKAVVLGVSSKHKESIEQIQQILSVQMRILQSDIHYSIGESYLCLAENFIRLARYSEAEELLLKAMTVFEETFYPTKSQEKIATTNFWLGEIRFLHGDYEKALPFIEASQETRRQVFTREHPHFLQSQQRIADIMSCQGNIEEAIKLCKRTIKSRTDLLGTDHPDLAESLYSFSQTLLQSNDALWDEASRQLVECAGIRKMIFGDDHYLYLDAISLQKVYQMKMIEKKFQDEAARATADATSVEPMHVDKDANGVPIFPGEVFYDLAVSFLDILDRYENCFGVGSDHPSILNTIGNFGIVKKLEFDCKEAWVSRLTATDRRLFRAQEAALANAVAAAAEKSAMGTEEEVTEAIPAPEQPNPSPSPSLEAKDVKNTSDAPMEVIADTTSHGESPVEDESLTRPTTTENGDAAVVDVSPASDEAKLSDVPSAYLGTDVSEVEGNESLNADAIQNSSPDTDPALSTTVAEAPETATASEPVKERATAPATVTQPAAPTIASLEIKENSRLSKVPKSAPNSSKPIPPGSDEIEYAIAELKSRGFFPSHPWLQTLGKYSLAGEVLSEFDIAVKTYQKACDLFQAGKFTDADAVFDEALTNQVGSIGNVAAGSNLDVARTVLGKAENLRMLGKLSMSEALFNKGISISQNAVHSGDSSIETCARGYFGLAEVLRLSGSLDYSKSVYEKSLEIRLKLLGPNHPAVAESYRGMAHISCDLGKFAEAVSFAEKAVAINLAICPGADDLNVAASFECYAYSLLINAAYEKASKYLTKAVDIRNKLLGNENFYMGNSMYLKACCDFEVGKFKDAKKAIGAGLINQIKYFGQLQDFHDASERSIKVFMDLVELITKDGVGEEETNQDPLEYVKSNSKNAKKDKKTDSEHNMSSVDDDDDELAEKNLAKKFDTSKLLADEDKFRKARKEKNDEDSIFTYKGKKVSPHPSIAKSLYLRAQISTALGNFIEGRELFKFSIKMDTDLFGANSYIVVKSGLGMARVMRLQGELAESYALYNKTYSFVIKTLDEMNPFRGEVLYDIGELNLQMCKLDKCAANFHAAFKIFTACGGSSHPKVAQVLTGQAYLSKALGNFPEATNLFNKALAIYSSIFGDLHTCSANVVHGLGECAKETGALDIASSQLEQAISVRSMLLGEEHPDTYTSLHSLAEVQRHQGKYSEAKATIEQCINARKQKLGKFHPDTAASLIVLAFVCMDMAKYAFAKSVLERATHLLRRIYGKDHSLVATSISGLGDIASRLSFYSEAKEFHETAVVVRLRLFGDQHPDVADSIYYLAELNNVYGNYEDAITQHDDALAMRRTLLGQMNGPVAQSLWGLGNALLNKGKLSEARSVLERSLAMRRAVLGPDHFYVAQSQYSLAKFNEINGKLEQAGALYERTFEKLQSSVSARHPLIASTLSSMADIANMMGKFDKAKALLTEALEIRKIIYEADNPNHVDLAQNYFAFAENLRLLGRYDSPVHELPQPGGVQDINNSEVKAAIGGKTTSNNSLSPTNNTSRPTTSSAAANIIKRSTKSANDDDNVSVSSNLSGSSSLNLKEFAAAGDRNAEGPTAGINAEGEEAGGGDEEGDEEGSVGGGSVGGGSVGGASIGGKGSSAASVTDSYAKARDEQIRQEIEENVAQVLDDISKKKLDVESEIPKIDLSQFQTAMPLYKMVLDMFCRTFSPDHLAVLRVNLAIAEIHKYMGRYDTAFPIFESVLLLRRRALGDTHVDTIEAMCAVGDMLRAMSKIYPSNMQASDDVSSAPRDAANRSTAPSLEMHLSSIMGSVGSMAEKWTPAATIHLVNQSAGRQSVSSIAPLSISKKRPGEKGSSVLAGYNGGYMGYAFPKMKKLARTSKAQVKKPIKASSNDDAKLLYDTGLSQAKRLFGDGSEHPVVANLMFGKAELMRARRQPDKSLPLFESAINIRRHLYPSDHPLIAMCLNGIGDVLRVENKFTKAVPLYEKALDIFKVAYEGKTPHPHIADVQNNLAMAYYMQSMYSAAEPLYLESMDVRESLLGNMHPATAQSLNNYAGLLHMTGKFNHALLLYQRALDIKAATFGETHPETASAMNNLGLLFKAQGQFQDAENLYKSALAIQKKCFGLEHQDVAATINNLAALYSAQDRKAEAMPLYRQSIELKRIVYGFDHPAVGAALNNYAGLLFSLEQYADAKDLYDEALRIRKKAFGDMHISVAETYNNLGLLCFAQGQYSDAKAYYEQSLMIKLETMGDDSPMLAACFNNLGMCLKKLGRADEAKMMYDKADAIQKKAEELALMQQDQLQN